jgi:hypothetical protein
MRFVPLSRRGRLSARLLLALCAVAVPLGAAAQVRSLPRVRGLTDEDERRQYQSLQTAWDNRENEAPPIEFDPQPDAYEEDLNWDDWRWQMLPQGLIYSSYMAGVKEPRMATTWANERNQKWLLDTTLGGRFGLARYGNSDGMRPEGWQVDIEVAAFLRQDMENNWDVVATDFRGGIPLTYGKGPWRWKFAYYHLSSHLGDEYIVRTGATRINFSRDAFVFGSSYYVCDELRVYGETGWAFSTDGGTQPWEFQFGIDYSPLTPTGGRPVMFWAINGHLREEVDFGGNFVVQVGYQWRPYDGTRLLRFGLQYYNGKSKQYEFFNQHEELIGFGLWFDY